VLATFLFLISCRGGCCVAADKSMLNTGVYTIATATTGSCGMVETAALPSARRFFPPGADKLKQVAQGAVRWLLASRTADGRIPYVISPWDNSSVVFQPITYAYTCPDLSATFLHPHLIMVGASTRSRSVSG
jgi:hypothetical protein